MVCIYRNKNYKIFDDSRNTEYIIWNTNKEFENGHVHIKNYNTAKNLIRLSLGKKLPDSKSKYILQSLIRLSDSRDYTERLNSILRRTNK